MKPQRWPDGARAANVSSAHRGNNKPATSQAVVRDEPVLMLCPFVPVSGDESPLSPLLSECLPEVSVENVLPTRVRVSDASGPTVGLPLQDSLRPSAVEPPNN